MRALMWLTVLSVGCGGDKDDDADGLPTGLDTDTDPGGGPDERCDDIPVFAIEGMGCAELASAFETTLDDADRCTIDKNCRVIDGQCEDWNQVGCWYVVNDCILDAPPPPPPAEQTPFPTISEFYGQSAGCATTQQCTCNGAVPTAACVDGHCELVFTYTR